MLRVLRPWLFPAATAGFVAAIVCILALHRTPPPPPTYVVMCGPDYSGIARLETKRRLIGAVIAGRLSLLQAAANFRDADRRGPRPAVFALCVFPGAASEEEGYCRSVISWVHVKAPREQAEELTRRLQAELDAHVRDGTLRLPVPDYSEE